MAGNATNSAEQMLYGTLLTLTFVSGLIDAASFIALGHVFTANMTGNVVFMAFALAGIPELSLRRSSVALLTALAGAVVAGHLDSRIRWEKRTSWLSIALLIEAAVLAIAAFVAWSGRAHLAEQSIVCAVIALTGFAMGVRNGTVRRLGVPDLSTTVLTLTVAGLRFLYRRRSEHKVAHSCRGYFHDVSWSCLGCFGSAPLTCALTRTFSFASNRLCCSPTLPRGNKS